MNQDNRSTFIGMLLIMLILLGWNLYMKPTELEAVKMKRSQDSITNIQHVRDSSGKISPAVNSTQNLTPNITAPTALQNQNLEYGDFAPSVSGTEQDAVIENDVFKITFTNKGGRIKSVLLKKYFKLVEDSLKHEHQIPLYIFDDSKNRFFYALPTHTQKGIVNTDDLYFAPSVSGNTIVYRAKVAGGGFIEQKYIIGDGYDIDYSTTFKGLSDILVANTKSIQLNVENYLDKLEKNTSYERSYSFQYYKELDETPDNQSGTKTETTELKRKLVQWVSQSNQFFNTTLISKDGGFRSATLETLAMGENDPNLKKLTAHLEVPIIGDNTTTHIKIYAGPNEYHILRKHNVGLEDVVNYGGSILGTINRWIIRPIFDFLHSIFGNVAICILLLTLIVKGLLYPTSYGMLLSQAKTAALKPELEKMKAKLKDPKDQQMAQMKLYQEYGVNPLGGCLPTLLQMPIWMALFRFFPASIDFRQHGFLWATDLTGPEEFIKFPFHLPIIGDHISLFAVLWGLSLIAFTWYSMKDVDMSGQPAFMKQMQYFMPLIFMVTFNSYAAGLSLYMLFSNLLNIGQTVVTKKYVINHEKIKAALDNNKKNPKKKGAFRQRLEQAMQQSQETAKQQQEIRKGGQK